MKNFLIILLSIIPLCSYADQCTLSGSTLDLGEYQPLTENETDSESQIMVNCAVGIGYTLQISHGMYGTSDSNRMLKNSSSSYMLQYNIYQDIGKTTLWGEDPTHTYQGTGTGSVQAIPIFSVIVAGQKTAVPGTYSDVLGLTINF